MSKLKKCLYLINLMERKGAMTLKEINDHYQYSSLYECTAEPTLLCTFSGVSLFGNTIFCIFANRNYYMYA